MDEDTHDSEKTISFHGIGGGGGIEDMRICGYMKKDEKCLKFVAEETLTAAKKKERKEGAKKHKINKK